MKLRYLHLWVLMTHIDAASASGMRFGQGPMGSSHDGTTAAQSALHDEQAKGEEPPQKSILGRLFGALVGNDTPGAEGDAQEGALSPSPEANVLGLGNLRKLRVDDVTVPKVDIIAVPVEIELDELVQVFREHGFSRLPVYDGTLDHPLGLILLKDLALQQGFGGDADKPFVLRDMLRPLIYAPSSMRAGVLLQKMQRERVHMALVIDEYGGVDGLVTIEDLIETIVGEIEDEHDDAAHALWKEEAAGVYLLNATADVDEVEKALGLTLRIAEDDQDIDSIGGLVFIRTGRIPAVGELVMHESGLQFEVVDADPRRIKRLRMRLPQTVPQADQLRMDLN